MPRRIGGDGLTIETGGPVWDPTAEEEFPFDEPPVREEPAASSRPRLSEDPIAVVFTSRSGGDARIVTINEDGSSDCTCPNGRLSGHPACWHIATVAIMRRALEDHQEDR